jgi:hypothetical protein
MFVIEGMPGVRIPSIRVNKARKEKRRGVAAALEVKN